LNRYPKLRSVLHNQVGMFENLKVEWVPGADPKVYFYGPEKQEIAQQEVGDKDLKEVLELLKEHGFVPSKKVVNMGSPAHTKTIGESVYELYEIARSFGDAKEFAESLTLNGVKGHLPTISSKEEGDAISEFLQTTIVNTVWLGASDAETEGNWVWVSGPDNNSVFWQDGTAKLFVNWNQGEPNNVGEEDCATFSKDGTWNDVQCEPSFYSVLVEYSTKPSPSPAGEEKRSDL